LINTIIFDIGDVLMNFDNIAYIHRMFQNDETERHVQDAIWGSGYWDEMDRGLEAQEALRRMVAADPDYEKEISSAFYHIEQCMGRKEYAIPWIQELKRRGYQVFYLSNYSTYVMKAKPEVLDFIPYMDGGVFSCEVRLIKPEPAIYRKLLDTYGLEPENCVFLDDRQPNLEPAAAMGIHTIRFESYPQAREKLEQLLQG